MIPSIGEMLRTLVSTPSVSCPDQQIDQSNIEVIHHLANWLDDEGFEVIVKPLETNKHKANLLAKKGLGEGGLVFAGHTDTVPCLESHWNVDPYALTEQDGRWYGLGTCDMKGFFPLALAAASTVSASKLQKPICIVATSDEETSMAGARELENFDFPTADAAVIGEPTDLVPAYTHKGIALLKITVKGVAGHSSNPAAGVNAIDTMHCFISLLMQFRIDLKARYTNEAFDVQHPTLNLGCLHAGDVPNRICSHAELQFDIRILPNMNPSHLVEEIERLAEVVSRETESEIDVALCCPIIPPFETTTSGKLVRHLTQATKQPPQGVAFGTEAPFYQALGIETVVFGPGSVNQAHQPDEYLSIDRIKPMQLILEDLIHTYCTSN
ncbi:MAG: acetylornithine deacetylase [Gammaproteobacteria bacterium]|nr:acetylornithine deacetylase [Gammaproteobacteria bacterium]